MSTLQQPIAPASSKQKKSDVEYIEYDKYIDRQVERTRRSVKLVDLSQAVLVLVIGLVGFLLTAAVLEHWIVPGGLGSIGRLALFAVMLGCGGYYLVRYLWPLMAQPINPAYAAQAIEREHPAIKNSLINFLLFRTQKQKMPGAVFDALEEQAAQRLSQTSVDDSVDRGALVKLGYVLLAVITVAIIYAMLSPKSSLATAARVLMPWANIAAPSRVRIENIEPGNVEVVQGDTVAISANIYGLRDGEQVQLSYDTTDGYRVNQLVAMQSADDAGKYVCTMPADGGAMGAVGVDQDLKYRIIAGDGRTIDFDLRVLTAPTIRVSGLHYDFPAYTGYLDRTIENRGDIRAIEGTKVTIVAQANTEIESAFVDLASDGKNDKRMRVEGQTAQAGIDLRLDGDRRSVKSSSYMLRYTSAAGLTNHEPPQHSIEITPDYPPEVELLEPQERSRDVRLNQTVAIAVDARDPDFALRSVTLKFIKQDETQVHDELLLNKPHNGRFARTWQFTPADYKLQPGDVVDYWCEAADVRTPQANRAASDRKQLRIVGDPNQQGDREGERREGPGTGDDEHKGAEDGSGQQSENGQSGEGGAQKNNSNEAGGNEGGNSGNDAAGNEANDSNQQEGQEGSQQQNNAGESQDAGDQNSGSGQQSGSQQRDSQQQGGEQNSENNAEGGASGFQQDSENGAGQDDSEQNGSGQSGEPSDSSDGSGEGGEGGESSGGGSSRPVANDGSNDAEAFEKMQRRLNDEERQNATREQREGSGGDSSDAEPSDRSNPQDRGDSTGESGTPQSAGESSSSDKPNEKPSGQQPDGTGEQPGNSKDGSEAEAGGDDAQQGTAAEPQAGGEGADTKADVPQGEGGEQNQTKPDGASSSTGGEERNASGDAGAGSETESQGAPDAQREMQQRDKTSGAGEQESESDQSEPPTPGHSKHESDSRGEQGGDRAGGGEEGGGQKAPREGTGSAGQNQAADEGAGQSADQGPGETGQRGGDSQTSDSKTGKPGEQQGNGSQQRDGTGQKPGGKPGESQANGQRQAASESTQSSSDQNANDNQQPSDPGRDQQDNTGSPGNKPTNANGVQQGSDGMSDGPLPDKFDGTVADADDANLDYARKQTKLVLDKLADQLDNNKVDQKMLDDLGWTEDDLRRFVDRWSRLRAAAERPGAEAAQDELDDRLRNLGKSLGPKAGTTDRTQDTFRDLRDGYQSKVPLKYRDRLKAYTEGVSRTPKKP